MYLSTTAQIIIYWTGNTLNFDSFACAYVEIYQTCTEFSTQTVAC